MARAEPIMGQRVAQKTNGTAVEARRFIIEFDGSSDVNALAAKLASQANTTVLRVFDTAIFKGASVSSSTLNADSLSALLKPSSPTTRVWSSNRIRLAKSVPSKLFSPAEAGAAAGNYSIHWSTGVDKLHAAGYTGKGATVAIVDTGTWYTHPALGGGFGPGYKVKGGLDLVGDGCKFCLVVKHQTRSEKIGDPVRDGTVSLLDQRNGC